MRDRPDITHSDPNAKTHIIIFEKEEEEASRFLPKLLFFIPVFTTPLYCRQENPKCVNMLLWWLNIICFDYNRGICRNI